MRLFITGANGQLGKACQAVFADHDLYLAELPDCDITNQKQCREILEEFKPDAIIHAAAYTNVRGAETDPLPCYRVNVDGTANLAQMARELDCAIVYVSTDFIFGGEKTSPYKEDDSVNPLNAYARSKYAGELVVRDYAPKHFILRTAWLYGDGKNFVQTILQLAEKNSELPVVGDQYGTPTYAKDLAEWIKAVLEMQAYGIYHATNEGETTWAGFAEKALELAKVSAKVVPISSEEAAERFNDPVKRPSYSVLDKSKLKKIAPIRSWEAALEEYLASRD